MISTFCDSILNVYTHCSTVKSVYTYGSLVWPVGPLPPCPPCEWYVSWTPTSLSQTVEWGYPVISSTQLRLSEYNGYFTDFSGVIPSRAFTRPQTDAGADIYYLNTNAYSISSGAVTWDGYVHGAFSGCSLLTLASLSNCSYIGRGVFLSCRRMSSVYAPVCEYVGDDAFRNCYSLSGISLPVCEYVGDNAFCNCSNLSFISLPECIYIGQDGGQRPGASAIGAFNGCYKLKSLYLPKCEFIGRRAFFGCSSLSSISLPVCSYIGADAFEKCSSLTGEIYLTECEILGQGAFAWCPNITKLTLPKCSSIGYYAINSCTNLSVLEIGYSDVCKIGGENLSRISSSFSVYVPWSLVDAYKISPIWSDFSSRIFPISSSEPMTYNISWTAASDTGYVYIDQVQYNLSDYQHQVGSSFLGHISTSQYIMRGSIFKFSECHFIDFETDMLSMNSTAFYSCSMSTLSGSRCMYISGSMSLDGLTGVDLPNCRNIGSYAFYGCSTLLEVNLPECTRLSGNAFAYCSSLRSITIPKCESVGQFVLYSNNCSVIDLPVCSYISSMAFMNPNLSLYLRSTSVVTISDFFNYNIYVPSSLYSNYVSRYSSYSRRIFSIPE